MFEKVAGRNCLRSRFGIKETDYRNNQTAITDSNIAIIFLELQCSLYIKIESIIGIKI